MRTSNGSSFNYGYARLKLDSFQRLHTLLAGKSLEGLDRFDLGGVLKTVINLTPFEPSYSSDEDRPRISLVEAYGYRILTWNAIDGVLAEEFVDELDRVNRIKFFVEVYEHAVRYLRIRELARRTDDEFAKLGLQSGIFDAIHVSDILIQRSGRHEYGRCLEIVDNLSTALAPCVQTDSVSGVLATPEMINDFLQRNHGKNFFFG